MKISVITINYNNKKGLTKTIENIRCQSSKSFEYIIVDGNSNDGSVAIIKDNTPIISKWVSEPDKGIYNAMNKAVRMASGEYCIFMNSGDVFYSKNTIENLMKLDFAEDFILGGVISPKLGLIRAKKKLTMADFIIGSIAHQASIIKRTLLLTYPYDEQLTIVSDWKFCIHTLIFRSCSFMAIDEIVAKEEPFGLSCVQNEVHKSERILVLRNYLPEKVLDDYKIITFFRKRPLNWIVNYFLKW